MKKVILYLICILTGTISFAKYENLRLVAGYPDSDYYDYNQKYVSISAILRIDGDSLIEEIALSDSSHILFFVRMYQEYDELFALSVQRGKGSMSQLFADSATSQLYVVNTKTLERNVFDIPYFVVEYDIKYNVLVFDTNIIKNDDTMCLVFKCMNFDLPEDTNIPSKIYYSLNISTGSFEKTGISVYRNIITNNRKIIFKDVSDGTRLRGDSTINGFSMMAPKHYGKNLFLDRPIAELRINKQFLRNGGGLMLNTDSVMVISFYGDGDRDNGRMRVRTFYVYNKVNMQWSPVQIKSNRIIIEYHQGYICGHQNVDTYDWGAFNIKREYWTKPQTKYGPSYVATKDYDSDWYENRAPYSNGDLFLYHVNTKNKIEWNTGHGDSEILLVKDEVVYYRVYDKIYCAKIIDHKSLDTPELIIQNTLVGDVHWAFFKE